MNLILSANMTLEAITESQTVESPLPVREEQTRKERINQLMHNGKKRVDNVV